MIGGLAMNNDANIIPLSSLFESNNNQVSEEELIMIDIEDEPPIETEEIIDLDSILSELPKEKVKKLDSDKLIEKIQIGLIIFLVVAGTIIYFFGYEFFEPYIKID